MCHRGHRFILAVTPFLMFSLLKNQPGKEELVNHIFFTLTRCKGALEQHFSTFKDSSKLIFHAT